MSRPTTTLAAVTSGAPAARVQDVVVGALKNALSKMKSVLPAHITPEKMSRLALGEMRMNPKLREAAQANPESLVSAMMSASQCGLEIGGAKGHGYLVPFWNNKTKRMEIQFIPGYRGLIDLSRRSGQVSSISVHVAYEHDEFDMVLGIDERLTHKPKLDGDRGAPRLVYGVARFTDGSHHFDWMPIGEVDAIMRGSQSKGEWGPWKDNKPEMIRKTMVRRLTKYLPMSSERLEKAIEASDSFDSGQTIDGDFTFVDDAPQQQAIGNDPSETASFQSSSSGDVRETVDRETGEIKDRPAANTKKAAPAGPAMTFAQVQHDIIHAKTLDELNDAVALIAAVGDEQQQAELREAAEAKRTTLEGN